MEFKYVALFLVAAVVILTLGVYAGRLLYMLKSQRSKQQQARNKRISSIEQSIQTISFAILQQQCDLSEGVIRICNLLDALPILPLPNYAMRYPATYRLYEMVKDFPTHDKRAAQPKTMRRQQDKQRQQFESELESEILKEAEELRHFSV